MEEEGNNSILALSDSAMVLYGVRTLAIKALAAHVARRDSMGTLMKVAPQTHVLSELGVGKGQCRNCCPQVFAICCRTEFFPAARWKHTWPETTLVACIK